MAIHIRRREFIVTLGGAAVCPFTAKAQHPNGYGVSACSVVTSLKTIRLESPTFRFTRALQQLGWTDGNNVRIDVRWAAGDVELMRRFARELVALHPDVILSAGTPGTTAVKRETRSIPKTAKALGLTVHSR